MDELAGGMPAQINCQVDAAGALRMRPGISAFTDFPTAIPEASPVVAIDSWLGKIVYVTQDSTGVRKMWALTSPGVVQALSTSGTFTTDRQTQLPGTARPIILPTRARVFFAGGGTTPGDPTPQNLRHWTGVGNASDTGPVGLSFTHLAGISQRVVGNAEDRSGIIYWTDVGDTGETTWQTGINFREAETKKDAVIGLYVSSNELVLLGTETIQMLSPDPSETFTPARTIEIGWGSPYSYIPFDEIFMGLDNKSRAVLCNGRSFDVISSPAIGQQLEDADTGDAWGFRYKVGNWDLGALMLPTDGRTFVYDAGSKLWTEWRGFDSSVGGYGAFDVTAAYYWPERKVTLVGRPDGSIAQLDQAATTDLGEPIVVQLTSTFEDRNSSRLKQCQHVRLKFRRGLLAVGEVGHLLLSWRDDSGPFCDPIRFDLGDPNDVAPVVEAHSLGTYRQRQWRIVVDSVAFRFAGAEEDFEVLDH